VLPVLLIAVAPAVQLDDEARCHAGKIGDIGTNGHLSTEMRTFDLEITQMMP
jgi:hypothetical protein